MQVTRKQLLDGLTGVDVLKLQQDRIACFADSGFRPLDCDIIADFEGRLRMIERVKPDEIDYDKLETNMINIVGGTKYRIVRDERGTYVPEVKWLFWYWPMLSGNQALPTREAAGRVIEDHRKKKREVLEYL